MEESRKKTLIVLLSAFLVFSRCHSILLLKALAEVMRVIQSHHVGNLCHVILLCLYELSCPLHAYFSQELNGR